MPRTARAAPGGFVFHVLNRGVGRMRLFDKPRDFEAFEEVLAQTLEKIPLRLCGYCLMPNHWHFVVWPEADQQLAAFFQRLTVTHVTRWAWAKRRVGYGHVYQARFKSFPIQTDEHFYQVLRYVERNAKRAKSVRRAVDWRWGSLWIRQQGTAEQKAWLSPWPVPRPGRWLEYVEQPQTQAELAALRQSVQRGAPYGGDSWVRSTADDLGLRSTLRTPGRPRQNPSHAANP
jgi:putative transposase